MQPPQGDRVSLKSSPAGLILMGGGARAAYQVGVLKAIAALLRDARRGLDPTIAEGANPFPIIVGTSAGAINAAGLACRSDHFQEAVAQLLNVWENFHAEQVYRSDLLDAVRSGARWVTLLSFGWMVRRSLKLSGTRLELLAKERKPLLDEAIRLSSHKPTSVVLVNRGLAPMAMLAGRDHDYASLRAQHMEAQVPCEWLESTEISYTIYTSGTTGRPKGVQRDVGGYAVALAASMKHIFMGEPGETYFSTSDIGWVVGHSYIVYGPLIAGMATIMYEGLPIRPDGGIWWSLIEKYKVSVMFSAPTAVRVLKKQDPAYLKQYDLSSLKALYLAGEPLDEPTARWIADGLGVPIIDNYWQTESGWPILTIANGVTLDLGTGTATLAAIGGNFGE